MAKSKPLPPLAELQHFVSYDPETGVFRRLVSTSSTGRAGDTVGTKHPEGYLAGRINGHQVLLHRVAWFMHYGVDPGEREIDHWNLDKTDNRIANLRVASHPENGWNRPRSSSNTSGHKGVNWDKKAKKWLAAIQVEGKRHHLGRFTDINDAIQAVTDARERLHGEFHHHG